MQSQGSVPEDYAKMVSYAFLLLHCQFATGTTEHSLRRNVRTSQGTFIARQEDKGGVLAWIEDRLAQLTGIPASHGEVRRNLLLLAPFASLLQS